MTSIKLFSKSNLQDPRDTGDERLMNTYQNMTLYFHFRKKCASIDTTNHLLGH